MQAIEQMKIAMLPVTGVLHIGASNGQERYEYQNANIPRVVWIEPIKEIFDGLVENIKDLPGQSAINAVCTDRDNQNVIFNIASNNGESSSILPLGHHAKIFPKIVYTEQRAMVSTTVDSIMKDQPDETLINLMIIDTQGAELQVLKGASKTIEHLLGIFVEISEEPLYEGGCTHAEIASLLTAQGFRLRWLSINGAGHGDAFYCRPRT